MAVSGHGTRLGGKESDIKYLICSVQSVNLHNMLLIKTKVLKYMQTCQADCKCEAVKLFNSLYMMQQLSATQILLNLLWNSM